MDKPQPTDATAVPAGPPSGVVPPKRPPGHRGADMRDTVAEMAERAQIISQEAGSKVAAAMKDVISAAAGIAGFAIESARMWKAPRKSWAWWRLRLALPLA